MKPLLCTHRSSAAPDRVWAVADDLLRRAWAANRRWQAEAAQE